MTKILDGKKISEKINIETKKEISIMQKKPCLVAIQIGDNRESSLYIKHKSTKAKEVGILFLHKKFSKNITSSELIKEIKKLNDDDDVDGIMVQLPLPKHIEANLISKHISPLKDVDGFNPLNKGLLDIDECELIPPTANGVITLFYEYEIDLKGKIITIIGLGEIAGKPLAKILINKNATLILCNKYTPDISKFTKQSDIVISAVGFKHLIKSEFIKKDSIVVNIGLTKEENKLYGDIEFDSIKDKTSFITPIIGGTGPMTVSLLLKNTLISRKNKEK